MGLLRPLFEKSIGSLVRHALTALGVVLVERGFANTGQVDDLILQLSPIVIAIAWSQFEKYRTQTQKVVAKELPANATDTTIKKVIATSTTAENIERALAPAD